MILLLVSVFTSLPLLFALWTYYQSTHPNDFPQELDLLQTSIIELGGLLSDGELTSVALVKQYLGEFASDRTEKF